MGSGLGIRISIFFALISTIIFFLATKVNCETLSSLEIDKLEKPQRPRVFTSPDELKAYLGALHRYYTSVSRNRFGKRIPLPIQRGSNLLQTFTPNEEFEFMRIEK